MSRPSTPSGSSSRPQVPERVGVVGGGRMGSGIAHAFLTAGSAVTVIEADASRGDEARASVARAVAASERRGMLSEPAERVLERVQLVTDIASLSGCGLAIEAVPEIPELKHTVLSAISDVVAGGAIIASNTSSLSISGLAAHVAEPARFLGLHFFNPVPASGLVEVIVGAHTGDETVRAAQQLVAAIGKTAVTVTDSPGFASSRLGVLLGLEAIRMVEQGVASPADIDAAMTLGYKHPVGPLRLTDLVGLDVRLGVAEYLESTLGERFSPPQLMRDMVARGELGRKTGRGFYDWSQEK